MVDLDDCRARVGRALAHLEALRSERRAWQHTNQEYVTEYEPGGWHTFRTTYIEPPPPIFALLASDYIHQLRAALDNLVCALAELNGTPCSRQHAFPVIKDAGAWKRAVNSRLLGLRQNHIDEIESVQPFVSDYRPDDHPFAKLDELSRMDKHRFLTPTPIALADPEPKIEVRAPGVRVVQVEFTPGTAISTDTVFLRVKVEPNTSEPDFNLRDAPAFYMSFGDPPINEESLERIGACVDEFVERDAFK